MSSSSFPLGLNRSWPLLTLLLTAAIWLHRTPYSASNLEVPPDTVEYALAPLQFLETGRYEIIVQGRGLPPRYPPWFPVLVILPAYALFGHDPGNAILPVTVLGVAGVGFAYAIGQRISSRTGGLLAGLGLLFLPTYSAWATQVMTDVPCTALMLGTCLLYLRLRAHPKPLLLFFWAGALVALTTLFRPVFAAMLLPFLILVVRQRKDIFLRGLLLLGPMAVAAVASLLYNAAAFGSPFRNGYHFWTPIPMDYPAMTFSISFVRMNLEEVGWAAWAIVTLVFLGTAILSRKRRSAAALGASQASFQGAAVFFALTTAPILAFHLLYFFPADRFHLPMMAGAAVLAASMLTLAVRAKRQAIFEALMPVALMVAVIGRVATPAPLPLRRIAAENIRKYTPGNAIVISAIDPVYLERLAGAGSSRRIVPLSRDVEYASALLVRKRVADPRLRGLTWDDVRTVAMIRPHAEEATPFIASERLNDLTREATNGTPVFFESSFANESASKVLAELLQHFKLVHRAPCLYQLQAL